MAWRAPTAVTAGQRALATDGGIFTFGGAHFYGSAAGTQLSRPIVGMAATFDNLGYWLVGADGGIFTFGSAPFQGSIGGTALSHPIVGIATESP